MNKKQKKEPFSLKNMNGLSHDECAHLCAGRYELPERGRRNTVPPCRT